MAATRNSYEVNQARSVSIDIFVLLSDFEDSMNRIFLRSSMFSLCGLLTVALLLIGCGSPEQASHTGHQANQQASQQQASNQAAEKPTPRIPAFFDSLDKAKPLPAVLDPKQFTDPVIAKAYSYAQQDPEIFSQQPCYCYCDSGDGHRSLLDCYATTHSVG